MTPKRVLALDLDGVLHPNVSPWRSAYELSDAPHPDAQEYVRFVQGSGWSVHVQTARANAPRADEAVSTWLRDSGFPELRVTSSKRHADVYLDDRALRFEGWWPSLGALEAAATPWNRR